EKKTAKRAALGQPHDGLVKYAFSKRDHAAGLLKAILAPAITALVDWGTLNLEKDSFIEPNLRRRYADLLLSAKIGGRRALFYVLVEHKREVEPLAIVQVGRYMHRVWDKLLRDEPGVAKLPAVVPVLLCNTSNTKAGWTAATRFEDAIDLPDEAREALLPHTPRFEARLVDLHPEKARDIAQEMLTAFGKLVLWALSVAGDDERFVDEIGRMKDAIRAALDAPDAHDALYALLSYLSLTHARLGSKRIVDLLKTAAERRQEEAIMDGLDDLRLEGRAQMLLKQLTARFGPVPAAAKAQILAAKQPALDRWAIRVLTEPSLEAVLGATKARPAKTAPSRKTSRAARV
ncbi:MAG: Rpn family recombination-promoting nuclease/putative transposase, partial [Myxococcota bacterium]